LDEGPGDRLLNSWQLHWHGLWFC